MMQQPDKMVQRTLHPPSVPWMRSGFNKTRARDIARYRTALNNHRQMQQKIGLLRSGIARYGVSNDSFSSTVADLQRHADSLHDFFSAMLGPLLYNEHTQGHKWNGDSPASRVLNTPELLELILSYVTLHDIVNYRQTTNYAKQLVDASAGLQTRLFLRADHEGNIARHLDRELYAKSMSSKLTSMGGKLNHGLPEYELWLHSLRDVPVVGSFYRQMLVRLPQVFHLEVTTTCCVSRRRVRQCVQNWPPTPLLPGEPRQYAPGQLRGRKKIRSKTGITLGEVLDAAQQLREKHRLCPWASMFDHDHDGIVKAEVVFYEHPPVRKPTTLISDGAANMMQRQRSLDLSPGVEVPRGKSIYWLFNKDYLSYKQAGKYDCIPPSDSVR